VKVSVSVLPFVLDCSAVPPLYCVPESVVHVPVVLMAALFSWISETIAVAICSLR
jgi:hypothetical protein